MVFGILGLWWRQGVKTIGPEMPGPYWPWWRQETGLAPRDAGPDIHPVASRWVVGVLAVAGASQLVFAVLQASPARAAVGALILALSIGLYHLRRRTIS